MSRHFASWTKIPKMFSVQLLNWLTTTFIEQVGGDVPFNGDEDIIKGLQPKHQKQVLFNSDYHAGRYFS